MYEYDGDVGVHLNIIEDMQEAKAKRLLKRCEELDEEHPDPDWFYDRVTEDYAPGAKIKVDMLKADFDNLMDAELDRGGARRPLSSVETYRISSRDGAVEDRSSVEKAHSRRILRAGFDAAFLAMQAHRDKGLDGS